MWWRNFILFQHIIIMPKHQEKHENNPLTPVPKSSLIFETMAPTSNKLCLCQPIANSWRKLCLIENRHLSHFIMYQWFFLTKYKNTAQTTLHSSYMISVLLSVWNSIFNQAHTNLFKYYYKHYFLSNMEIIYTALKDNSVNLCYENMTHTL